MKAEYDGEADAFAIQFQEGGRDVRTLEVAPGIYLDMNEQGQLMALEVLEASKHFSPDVLARLPLPTMKMLSLVEAAEESGLSETTLRRQIGQGRIAAEKRGRDWVIDELVLTNYLESRERSGRLPAKRKARIARGAQKKRKSA